MEGGNFDLKGLAEWGVKASLNKFDLGHLVEHISPMVGPIFDEFKVPTSLTFGPIETLFTKAIVAGLDMQRERTRLAELRKQDVIDT